MSEVIARVLALCVLLVIQGVATVRFVAGGDPLWLIAWLLCALLLDRIITRWEGR